MRRPRASRRGTAVVVAAAVAVTVVGMMAFSFASLVLPGTERIPDRPTIVDFLAFTAMILAFPLVGAVIVTRRPGNPVGWLFLVTGLSMALAAFSTEYPGRVAFAGADLPGAGFVAWLGTWAWLTGPFIALPLAILVFPDGAFPGPRWRAAAAIAFGVAGLVVAAGAFAPGELHGYGGRFHNPLGAPGEIGALAARVSRDAFFPVLAPGVLTIVATGVRFRRARGSERQQLKWLLYPVALFVVGFGLAIATPEPWMWSLALTALAIVPVAAGIAILRYRLYDIDVVIRRTVVYGVVVVVLGAAYVGSMLGLQSLLSGVTGGETLPVALSTLAIAALFGPVRAHVRRLVDRRFFRSRYDAQSTLEQFAVQVRDQVELEAVGTTLVDVARRAVQPSSAGVWLRAGSPR